MRRLQGGDRHYRVVRFFTDFSAGDTREELADRLTLAEAEKLADQYRDQVPGEEIVIQDQDQTGLDAEILVESTEGLGDSGDRADSPRL